MKLLDANEERVIVRLKDKIIVIVKEDEIVLKYKVGDARKTKKFGYIDMVEMNNLICKIMRSVIEERNKLKQRESVMFSIPSLKIIGRIPSIERPFEEKTRK